MAEVNMFLLNAVVAIWFEQCAKTAGDEGDVRFYRVGARVNWVLFSVGFLLSSLDLAAKLSS
jgi:hypothetical protein